MKFFSTIVFVFLIFVAGVYFFNRKYDVENFKEAHGSGGSGHGGSGHGSGGMGGRGSGGFGRGGGFGGRGIGGRGYGGRGWGKGTFFGSSPSWGWNNLGWGYPYYNYYCDPLDPYCTAGYYY